MLNTYRDRMIALLEEAAVSFVPSRLVPTAGVDESFGPLSLGPLPLWVKRSDVHNTQEGDVTYADTAGAVQAALAGLAARGMQDAVLQPHVDGDLTRSGARRVGTVLDLENLGPTVLRDDDCSHVSDPSDSPDHTAIDDQVAAPV